LQGRLQLALPPFGTQPQQQEQDANKCGKQTGLHENNQ
jgi:hypothetical protein